MTSYLRDMDGTYTKMIKEDEGTRLSEVTLVRRLLRRSGLNQDEYRYVLASCGRQYDLDKILSALRLTYGNANRDHSKRRFSQTAKDSPTPRKKPAFLQKPPFRRFKKHGVNHIDTLLEEDAHHEEHDHEEDEHEADDDDDDEHEQPVEDEQSE